MYFGKGSYQKRKHFAQQEKQDLNTCPPQFPSFPSRVGLQSSNKAKEINLLQPPTRRWMTKKNMRQDYGLEKASQVLKNQMLVCIHEVASSLIFTYIYIYIYTYKNISWGNILKCRCPNVKEFVWLFDKWPFIMPSASLRTFPSNSFQISWDVIYDWSSGEERGLSKAHK